jgi:hypothetical protein
MRKAESDIARPHTGEPMRGMLNTEQVAHILSISPQTLSALLCPPFQRDSFR